LVVSVRDYGSGFAARCSTVGQGTVLMQALASAVSMDDADPGVAVRMTFQFERTAVDAV
jgi:hypothetical protein